MAGFWQGTISRRACVFTALGGPLLASCVRRTSEPAAGERKPAAQPVRLRWWSRGTPEWNDMLQEVTQAYMRAFPHVTLDYEFQPSEGYTDKILAAAASDTMPDVFHLNSQHVISLAAKGVLLDLTPLLEGDKEIRRGDFFPWAWLRAEYQGKLYAMPLKGTCNVMWINRDLFDRNGLALPPATWTWEQYVTVARRLSNPPEVWGGWTYPWQVAVWQNGGELIDRTGKRVLLDQAAAYEAIQWVADHALTQRIAPLPSEAQDLRRGVPGTSGRVAIYPGGEPDFGAFLKVTDFQWTALPMPPGKQQASFGASTLFGMDPKGQRTAPAWAFLKWFTTGEEAQSILNKAGKMGVPPYRPVYEKLFLNQPPRSDVKKVLGDMAQQNRPYLEQVINAPEIEAIFSQELAPVWRGEATAREATRRVAEKITPLL